MAGAEPATPLSPLAAAIIGGELPRQVRLSAARGVLPLARPELVRVLVSLQRDADPEVCAAAAAGLAAMPGAEIDALLGDPATDPDVLRHFALDELSPAGRLDLLIAHPSTPADALAGIVWKLGPLQIDQILLNQTRLIASPDLLDAVAAHPAITPPQRARVEEFRRHFLDQPRRGAGEETAPEGSGLPAPVWGPPEEAAPAAESLPPLPGRDEPATQEEVAASEQEAFDNATRRILRMNTAEKIQLAFKGSREERSLLIKDSSKLVQEAVMQSPKITENEVETIARMRSVTEDVLRIIAGNRDWSKNYAVIHALATNPRTPPSIAMSMVARLNLRDLKLLAGDRNVSEIVRRHARKTVDNRNERTTGRA